MTAPTQRRGKRLLSALTSALIVAAGLVTVPATAQAAPAPDKEVAAATLEWGVKASFRNYIYNIQPVLFQGRSTLLGNTTQPVAKGVYNWSGGTGTAAADGSVADVSYGAGNGVHFESHPMSGAYALDITFTNPRIEVSGSTGTLYLDVKSREFKSMTELSNDWFEQTNVAFADLTLSTPTTSGDTLTWANAAATLTSDGAKAFGGFYPAEEVLDPLTFSLPLATPAAQTTTTLATSAASVTVGETIDLTATVAPAEAAGSVTFTNNGTAIAGASNIAVSNGTATANDVALPLGANSITAEFTPADAAVYTASASEATSVQVTQVPATQTETAISAAPAAPVKLGTEVTLGATVTASTGSATPAGTVEFFSVAAGTTTRATLGSAAVDSNGKAEIKTTALTAGGFTFAAVFTPSDADAFVASEQATTANYGVVDTAEPTPYEPGAYAQTAEGATASWDWNAYSAGWTKKVSGNVALGDDTETFELTEGTVRADAGGAVVSFTGTLRVQAYEGFFQPNGQWVELIDPALHLNADGTGVWVAGVNTGVATYVANPEAPRLVVGVVDGYTGGSFGVDGERTVSFAYAGTTAPGTWSVKDGVAFDSAWPNAFVLQAPSAIRSFYYSSGASGDANKPASDLVVDFAWPNATTTELAVAPANSAGLGDEVTLTANVTDGVEGSVEFFTTAAVSGAETSIGTATVADGVATLKTTALVAGGHTFRAVFTPSNGYAGSGAATTANYGVIDATQPVLCTPKDAVQFEGVTASWAWNAYSTDWEKFAGGNIALADDGETFVLSNGVASYSADCTSIAFTGTLRVEAYQGFFQPHGQWVELVDPVLTLDANGNGAWSAGVRSGANDLNENTSERIVIAAITGAKVLDFAQDKIDATVGLDYAGTTAAGTWAAKNGTAFADAWSNAFILKTPSAIRSFYYASGAGGDVKKAPAAVDVDWAWAPGNLSASVNGDASGELVVKQGETVTFTAGSFADRDTPVGIEVRSDVVKVASVKPGLDGTVTTAWKVPADFERGKHTVLFQNGTQQASVTFTVEKAPVNGGGSDNGTTNTTGAKLSTTGGADVVPGILVGGAVILLLGAGALVLARRRQSAER